VWSNIIRVRYTERQPKAKAITKTKAKIAQPVSQLVSESASRLDGQSVTDFD